MVYENIIHHATRERVGNRMILNFNSSEVTENELFAKIVRICKEHPECKECELLKHPLQNNNSVVFCEHTKK